MTDDKPISYTDLKHHLQNILNMSEISEEGQIIVPLRIINDARRLFGWKPLSKSCVNFELRTI